jgi:cell division protein FtsZ
MPSVAEIAAEEGALVIAFVTMPFSFEGGRRLKQAEEGLAALRRVCDAVIPLPNDVLLQEAAENETVLDSFARADEWMGRGVKSIWAMLFKTGLINLDFSTLRQVFQQRGGKTLFGLGEGSGANSVADAVASLKLCPLLHTPEFSRKADRLLVNIIGGTDLTLPKVNDLMTAITEQFGRESHIIMGAVIDEEMQNRLEVCVLGTCDMNARSVMSRRPVTVNTRTRVAAGRGEPATEASRSGTSGSTQPTSEARPSRELSLEEAAAAAKNKIAQEEFGFGEIESRGHFEKTDRNLFDGQDLDVPTYLRRGIKISI